jgi:hypothetical protein
VLQFENIVAGVGRQRAAGGEDFKLVLAFLPKKPATKLGVPAFVERITTVGSRNTVASTGHRYQPDWHGFVPRGLERDGG